MSLLCERRGHLLTELLRDFLGSARETLKCAITATRSDIEDEPSRR